MKDDAYVERDAFHDSASNSWYYCGAIDLQTGEILAHYTLIEARAAEMDFAQLCTEALIEKIERGEAEVFAAPQVPERYHFTADAALIERVEQSYTACPGAAHAVKLRGKKHQGEETIQYTPVTNPLVEYDGRLWLRTSGSWGMHAARDDSEDDTVKTRSWLEIETHMLNEVVTCQQAIAQGLTPRRPTVNEARFAGLVFDWQPPDGPLQEMVLTDNSLTLVEPATIDVPLPPPVKSKRAKPGKKGSPHQDIPAPAIEAAEPVIRQTVLFPNL